MTRRVHRPILPNPPREFNARYMADLTRAIEDIITAMYSPYINYRDIPSDGEANTLEIGDFYEANGFVMVKRQGVPESGSASMTAGAGSVTVTTT